MYLSSSSLKNEKDVVFPFGVVYNEPALTSSVIVTQTNTSLIKLKLLNKKINPTQHCGCIGFILAEKERLARLCLALLRKTDCVRLRRVWFESTTTFS